jgi:hypothetical protein
MAWVLQVKWTYATLVLLLVASWIERHIVGAAEFSATRAAATQAAIFYFYFYFYFGRSGRFWVKSRHNFPRG